MDGRRRQWVPIASDLAWTRTSRLLADKFGPEGPLVWVLVLLAAKRSLNQGQFQLLSEADGWAQLGWDEMGLERPSFTLKEFFQYTGQSRRTRRTGRHQVSISSWTAWNQEVIRDQTAEQKRRKRAQKTPDIRTNLSATDSDLDSDSEREGDISDEQRAKNAQAARRLHAELTRKLGAV